MNNYKVYDILSVRASLDILPSFMETGNSSNPDIEIIEKDIDIDDIRYSYKRFPIRFSTSKNSILMEFSPKRTLLRVLLNDLEGRTKVFFEESGIYKPLHNVIFPSWPSITNIIRFLLQVKFLQKDVVMIHAATLSKDGVGIMMPTWPGTGKSTACRNLTERGYDILGDEIALLSRDRTLYKMFESGMFTQKSLLNVFNRKSRFSFSNIESEKLDKVILLKRGTPKISTVDVDEIINMMLASSSFEFQNSFTRQLFLGYCFSNGFDPSFVENKTKKILKRTLRKTDCYVASGNRKTFHKTISKIMRD